MIWKDAVGNCWDGWCCYRTRAIGSVGLFRRVCDGFVTDCHVALKKPRWTKLQGERSRRTVFLSGGQSTSWPTECWYSTGQSRWDSLWCSAWMVWWSFSWTSNVKFGIVMLHGIKMYHSDPFLYELEALTMLDHLQIIFDHIQIITYSLTIYILWFVQNLFFVHGTNSCFVGLRLVLNELRSHTHS